MIDIIIPAYNSHETIYKTLMSISLQVIRYKLKVYIIDDCSDKPYDYLKEDFNDLDITIKRLDKNMGPGVARNIGLEISNSEYIFFLDSDDMIVNEFSLRTMYNNIEDNDLLVGNVEYEQKDKSIELIEYDDISVRGKIFKRSIIEKYDIKFPDGNRGEDMAFFSLYLCTNPKIKVVDEYLYYYNYNENSLTHKKEGYEEFKSYKTQIECTKYAAEECLKKNLNKIIMEKNLMNALIYYYYEYEKYYGCDYQSEMLEWIKPLSKIYLDNKELINEKELIDNYNNLGTNNHVIPHISWYDFIGDK